MANYLDNLVATSLNLANAVQPRLASLFEPIQPRTLTADAAEIIAPMPDALPVAGTESVLTPDAMHLTKNSPRAEPAGDQAAKPILPVTLSLETEKKEPETSQPSSQLIRENDTRFLAPIARPSLQPASASAARAPGSSIAPIEPRVRARDNVDRRAKITDRDLLDASQPRNEVAPALPVLPATPSPETEKEKPDTPQPSSQLIRENDSHLLTLVDRRAKITDYDLLDASQPRNEIAPALPASMNSALERAQLVEPSLRQSGQLLPATVIVQPNIARQDQPRASKPTQPTPAPVIRVTIGRIEVRANLPNPAPPRAAPPAPKMSLDEYLRVQHGGNG